MTKQVLAERISELGAIQPWNHNFKLLGGVETRPGVQSSQGKNLIKWERIKPILEIIGVRGRSVLDIGCSEGFFSFQLARQGAKVLAADIDENRIRKAKFICDVLSVRELEFKILDIYSKDFEKLPTYDLCLCMGFLHRIPDPFTAIQRLTLKANIIIFEWKALKEGPHDEPFAYFSPGDFNQSDFFGTQYWILSFSCVESILQRLGYGRFHRIDDARSKRAILVAGCIDNPIFEKPDVVIRQSTTRNLLRHTKRYIKTVAKVFSGKLNA